MNFFNFNQPPDKESVQKPTDTCEIHVEATAKVKKKTPTMTQKDGKSSPKKKRVESVKYSSPARKCKASSQSKKNEKGSPIKAKVQKSPKKEGSANTTANCNLFHKDKQQNLKIQAASLPSKKYQSGRNMSKELYSVNNGTTGNQSRIAVNPPSNGVKIKIETIDRAINAKPSAGSTKNSSPIPKADNRTKETIPESSMETDKQPVPIANKNETNHKSNTVNHQKQKTKTNQAKTEEIIDLMDTDSHEAPHEEKEKGGIITLEADSEDDSMEGDFNQENLTYKQAASINSSSNQNNHSTKKPTQHERLIELEKKGFKQAAEIQCFREYYTRFQLIVATPDNPATKESFYKNSLGQVIDIIRAKGCPKAVLLPYLQKDAGRAHITTYKRFDERMSMLELYFHTISRRVPYNKPNSSSIKKYVDILIAHELEPASMVNDIRDTLECMKPKINIYLRENQAEKVKSVGWLFLSTWQMDGKEMGKILSTITGATCTCRFRQISNVKLMQKFKGAKQEVIKATKAMHVETDETKFRKVKEFMDKFNSSSRPRFVNDALLRFVPEFQPNKVTMSVKTSINELALKQYQACSGGMKFSSIEGLMGELTQSIKLQDQQITTIRQIILSIPSHEDPKKFPFLFHALEHIKDGPVVVYQTSVSTEAAYMAEHMVEYLRWKYGKNLVKEFFDLDTVRAKKKNKWNEEAWGVVTLEDKEFAAVVNDNYFITNTPMFDLSAMQTQAARKKNDENSSATSFHLDDADIQTIASGGSNMTLGEDQKNHTIINSLKAVQLQVPLNAPERNTPKPILKKKNESKKHAAIIAQLRNDCGDNQAAFDLTIKALESQGVLPPGTSG